MKELYKWLKILLIPYYMFERKYVSWYIKKFFNGTGLLIDFSIEDIYPYWLRQYDDHDKTNYYDSYFKPLISISYNSKFKDTILLIAQDAILKDRLRWTHFYWDYICVDK